MDQGREYDCRCTHSDLAVFVWARGMVGQEVEFKLEHLGEAMRLSMTQPTHTRLPFTLAVTGI